VGAPSPRGRADRPQAGSAEAVEALLGLIAAEPDITIAEMRERLLSEAGVSASVGTIWTFLDRAGLTFKKRRPTRPSRSGRTS
jgi:transposase